MYGTEITLNGTVVDEVQLKTTATGLSRLSFRVVSTERRRDKDTGQWTDGHKLFVTVTFWREFAENVALSLKKGDPIVVLGKLYSRQYVKDETNRVIYELEPTAIGHNLARGVTRFEKRARGYVGSVEVDEDGFPEQPSDEDEYILIDDDSAAPELAVV